MRYQEFYYWCRDAVCKIRYTPDRDKVYTELYTHLEDRYESYLASGLSEKEAVQKALAAMGDPKELAPQLAEIHKPYWAYAMHITRFLVSVLFCLTLGHGIVFLHDQPFLRGKELHWSFDQAEEITSVEQNAVDRSDGYTFRVTEAKVYRVELPETVDGKDHYNSVYTRMEVSNPRPWALEQSILDRVWAVDNFGNLYYSLWNRDTEHNGSPISIMEQRQGLNFYRYDLCFHDTAENTRWIELRYDRAGRDLVLRIDLTGGEHNVESS